MTAVATFLRALAINLASIGELFGFLWKRRLFWLAPLVIMLIFFALLFAVAATPVVGPFIYTLS